MATPGSAISKYVFRCSTHLRAQKKVKVTLQMLMDLKTPLAVLEVFDIKELVKRYAENPEYKESARKVLQKIRQMKVEEKRRATRKTLDADGVRIPRIQKKTIAVK
ncbi:Protein CBG16824 [Caenorhabditis briggsae]|uniref:Uncharacterized protein n=2 Tax=Caenorhabditis briggsae TaxID=6238 RepID=A0AAE9JI72_CAEBR|nr:Protein CBG16824 [Caenorhabditis briggsae]ULT97878.1 hypothetical protein L3Y34_005606 [Caenorhabditis briggsae]UMM31058.1 hypothetical protein L5515_012692 [Caenorhabditis briggsae]CAP34688.2 Protein CBG16824 [Caenorhabditis briggsae]